MLDFPLMAIFFEQSLKLDISTYIYGRESRTIGGWGLGEEGRGREDQISSARAWPHFHASTTAV